MHLHVTPEESLERIRQRNRSCESGISVEYLRCLYDAYEEFLTDISKVIPVLKVDYHTFKTAEVIESFFKKKEIHDFYNI